MSKIQTLNEHLTNMIAAGEVVERPMGIVKELVENSIDADSKRIIIKITNGGNDAIQVIDDGCGMDQVDAVNAFNRHATSKIKNTDDLWTISTMGFRGEALPSIASVSKVTLMTNDNNQSTKVMIDNGKIISATPYPTSKGTNILVEKLFYKTPARLKHLKGINIETNAVLDLVEKFALANPSIAFELYCDDKLKLKTVGNGNIQEVLLELYGLDIVKNSVEIEMKDYDFNVKGIIVLPSYSRSSKQYINCFINKRIVRSLGIQKAITESYSPYLMSDRYPIVILNVEADYRLVDVNVHPSKWEIRLSKERQLQALISEEISKVLKEKMNPGEIKVFKQEKQETYTQQTFIDYKPKEKPSVLEEPKKDYHVEEPLLERFQYLAQYHGKYILAFDDETLYVIDQHAAQERCMYEEIQNQILNNDVYSQTLLVPLIVDVSPSQANQIDKINEVMKCLNIELELFSKSSFSIHQVPVWFEDIDENSFMHDLIDLILSDKQMDILTVRKEKIASLACHSSVRFNRYLSVDESKKLLSRLSKCIQPFNCPHGRPTMMKISDTQLEKEFKRVL